MIVKFKCKVCGTEGNAEVPDRAQAVGVGLWLGDVVMRRVGDAHRKASNGCTAKTVELAIPIDEDQPLLGGKVSDELVRKTAEAKFSELVKEDE